MITNKQKRQFEEDGFFIVKNAISEQQVKKSLKAYERMREKCESYKYIYFRKYADIALNDIYGIEHIFHPEIFEEDIFESIMQCNILEISQELMETEKVFLSRNRLHCTRKISHSGYWHRDGTPSKVLEDIDEMLKKSQKELIHIQASLVFYPEDGFYVVPGSHKFQEKGYIKTKDILGTKKLLGNEVKIPTNRGDLLVFNPFIIHRGTCVGQYKKQRSHIHLRFSRVSMAEHADRYKGDKKFFASPHVLNTANENWKNTFNYELIDPTHWYGEGIVQKKFNLFRVRSLLRLGLIAYNRILYNLSRFYPGSQRNLENNSIIKYPFLK
jgi:ectoine hydroxylase-related dioxygenase (phytanoyl-CoA dioxygenase family)